MKKVAHWIKKTHLFLADEYICSACGASFRKPAKRCANCGVEIGSLKYIPSWVDEAALMEAILGGDW